MIIERDGKFYEQTISEVEIDIEAEKYKLSAWESALEVDALALAEYKAKIADIDALKIDEAFKDKLKESVVFQSPSGIKPEQVEEVRAKVAAIDEVVATVIKVK